MARSLTDPRYKAMISRLVEMRQQADLTQRDVATSLGESQTYVWKIEKCQQRLDPIQLVEWLRALDADEAKFLTDVVATIPSRRKK